ncbi:MAG: DUF4111 domain-containing protein [Anaerolineae bacterium]|nr:DUF4111 domain-containing protein [Anaerolineae bacterium]
MNPTPYPELNTLFARLLAGVQTTLGDALLGLYLHGSLAAGDFDPQRSDVDFLVVTAGELEAARLPTLAAMHADITDSGLKWADRLEGSYIPQAALRRYDPAHASHPALRVDGSFDVDFHASDWIIQRWVIREHGIALVGPDPHTFIDPVAPEALRGAVRGILREWWLPQVDDPFRLATSEYRAYAILTMCRSLYTLEHGAVVSKPAAGRWAQAALGEPRAALIGRALTWEPDTLPGSLDETLDFIRETLERAEV